MFPKLRHPFENFEEHMQVSMPASNEYENLSDQVIVTLKFMPLVGLDPRYLAFPMNPCGICVVKGPGGRLGRSLDSMDFKAYRMGARKESRTIVTQQFK